MQKITPHLWYDKEAKEAAKLYTETFPNSKIITQSKLEGTPSGEVDLLSIELDGQKFALISAGPYFKFNPSVSFLVACKTKEEVDEIWQKISVGGKTLMPLQSYPFSEHYGWTTDCFGLSWQIMHMGDRKITQRITPTMMFVGDNYGKAEEAINYYAEIFRDTKINSIMRYEKGEEPDKEGAIKHCSFTLENQNFATMESAHKHDFQFNEAVSFIVNCETQKEIDYYWDKLSAVPESEQCGWLKDKYGLSWQIVPTIMNELMKNDDKEKLARVTQAFLQMKKFDIEKLRNS